MSFVFLVIKGLYDVGAGGVEYLENLFILYSVYFDSLFSVFFNVVFRFFNFIVVRFFILLDGEGDSGR